MFAPYPANKELWGLLDSGGVAILAPLSFVGALFIARKYKVKRVFRFITYLALLSVATHYLLAGNRGSFLVIFVGAISVYWFLLKRRSKVKALNIVILGIFTVRFLVHWGNVRMRAYEDGLLNAILQTYPIQHSGNFSVADFTLIPASFGHYLHVVDLYAQGVRLHGETFLALIPQAIPSFVANWLDYEIPLNSAWRLAAYRTNGGGMYIFAEAFWNFGFWGPTLLAAVLSIGVVAIERYFSGRRNVAKMFYFGFVGSFSFSVFYGMLPMVRMFQIIAVVMVIIMFSEQRKKRRAPVYSNSRQL